MLALGRWTVKICCFLQSRSKHCPCLDQLFRRYMEVAVIIWRNKGKTGQVCRLFHWKKIPTDDFHVHRFINISLLLDLLIAVMNWIDVESALLTWLSIMFLHAWYSFGFYFLKKWYTMEKGPFVTSTFSFHIFSKLVVSFGPLGRAEHLYRSY
jgi:hypothetical protein